VALRSSVLHDPVHYTPKGQSGSSSSPRGEGPDRQYTDMMVSQFSAHSGGGFPELWPIWSTAQSKSTVMYTQEWLCKTFPSASSLVCEISQLRAGDSLRNTGPWSILVTRPGSWRRIIWEIVCLLSLAWDVVFLPLQAFSLPQTSGTKTIDLLTTVLWSIDILLSFFSGYNDSGLLELRLQKIASRYFRTWFIVDILIVGTDWFILFAELYGTHDLLGIARFGKVLRIARGLRLLHLLRIIKMISTIAEFSDLIRSEWLFTLFGIMRITLVIVVVNHFIACAWFGIGNVEHWGDVTWVEFNTEKFRVRENHQPSGFYHYATSLHWSLTQFTPASMEVYPVNLVERVFTVVVIISGLITFSSFVSSITSAMTHLRQINYEQARQQECIRRYITENTMPLELANRIYAFLRHHRRKVKGKRVHETEIKMFGSMPESLRMEIHVQVYLPALSPHPLFHHMREAHASGFFMVCHRAMSQYSLLWQEELFIMGEKASQMYFLSGGSLNYEAGEDACETISPMEIGEDESKTLLEGGAFICEMALWLQWEHRGHAMAHSYCELMCLNAANFIEVVRRTHVFRGIAQYAKTYAERLQKEVESGRAVLSDAWGTFDMLQELAQNAFATCSSPYPAPTPLSKTESLFAKKSMMLFNGFRKSWS